MLSAIELAEGQRTHPNPRVGSLVVDVGGVVVGRGAHVEPGGDHAEVIALRDAGSRARGGTIYVTLEPCSHTGRTPPCVKAIVEAGISRVVYAIDDPDPRVSGTGAASLKEAGVSVDSGVGMQEALALDPAYHHHRATGLPTVRLKYAMTLDGSVAAVDGSSRWISSEESRKDAHQLRARSDAVIVGAGTIRTDDPELSVRLEGYSGPQPMPVVIAGRSPLPSAAAVWDRDPLVVSALERDLPAGRLIVVPGSDGLPDPRKALEALAEEGLLELLLEGGPKLAGSWWRANLVSEGVLYLSGKIGGGQGVGPLAGAFAHVGDADVVSITGVRSLGDDLRVDFHRLV